MHNILYEGQFGFQKNHSTAHALASFVDTVTESLDKNDYVLSLFIDLSKAFDTIDHSILLQKLYHYGIRGIAYSYLKSYLSNRLQCIQIDSISSNYLPITCGVGVPQGSILGPLLFLIYINDIHKCSNLLKLLLFADDTTIIHASNDINKLISTLNKELALILNWFQLNRLSLNVKKINYIIFSNRK